MKIVLVGYGKMGQAIEQLAIARGHQIVEIIEANELRKFESLGPDSADVAIEFTQPNAAVANYKRLIAAGLPVVTGTTGWLNQEEDIKALAQARGIGFLYASNFSPGVNILFSLNRQLAKLMNRQTGYDVFLEERHHRYKKDSPSGTAEQLANDLLAGLDRKQQLAQPGELNNRPPADEELSIGVTRAGEIKGEHRVVYESAIDRIEISHQAYSRQGFALGAVLAAEWLPGRAGWFSMQDVLESG